jgi:hypothetical protein
MRTRDVKQKVYLLRVVDALNLDIPIPMRILPLRVENSREGGFEYFHEFPFIGITIKFRR